MYYTGIVGKWAIPLLMIATLACLYRSNGSDQALPLGSYGIGGDARIGGEYHKTSGDGLADENPVKGVFVIVREAGKLRYRCFVQGQRVYVVASTPFLHEFVGRLRQGKLAQFVFDDDFPCGRDTQKDLVVRIGEDTAGGIR
jgi:hypothetical protein